MGDSNIRKGYDLVTKGLRTCDIFGLPITLKYNGEDTYTTPVGGCTSVIVILFLAVYSITQLVAMFGRQKDNVSTVILQTDLSKDQNILNIEHTDFRFAIGLRPTDIEQADIDHKPEWATVTYKQHTMIRKQTDNKHVAHPVSPSDAVKCGDIFEDIFGKDESKNFNLHNHLCPKSFGYELSGNNVNRQFNYLEIIGMIDMAKLPGNPQEFLQNFITNNYIELVLTQYHFDTEDYENPKKASLHNEVAFPLMSGFTVHKHIKLKVNKATDYKNFFWTYEPDEYTFYSVEEGSSSLTHQTEPGVFFRIFLELDSSYTHIERRSYNIYDVFAQVGGVMGILVAICTILITYVSSRLFIMSMLSKFYTLHDTNHKNEPDLEEIKEENEGGRELRRMNMNVHRSETKQEEMHSMENSHYRNKSDNKIYPMSGASNLSKIKRYIYLNKLLVFKLKDYIQILFCCNKIKK